MQTSEWIAVALLVALFVAVVLTWVSGLDYARTAPALFRGKPARAEQ